MVLPIAAVNLADEAVESAASAPAATLELGEEFINKTFDVLDGGNSFPHLSFSTR